MWNLIVKNLWSRRKRNGWIFAELVVVTIVLFVLLDKAVVSLYDTSLPLGYDVDRLCVVSLSTYGEGTPKYIKERSDSASFADDAFVIFNKIKSLPEVETATPNRYQYLNCSGSWNVLFRSGDWEKDAKYKISCLAQSFHPGYNFFETYGIKAVEVSPSAEELSKMSYTDNDVVLTKSFVDMFYKGENVIGKQVFLDDWNDTIANKVRVVGVVDDVRYRSDLRTYNLAFCPQSRIEFFAGAIVVVRLKPGVDVAEFVEHFSETMEKEMTSGNYYAENIKAYTDVVAEREDEVGLLSQHRMYMAFALFFLINLCLGVIGTFWLQTRSRTEEAGIMRSFGATRWGIRKMLLGEGLVMSSLSVFVGCIIYLQIAWETGLAGNTADFVFEFNVADTWVSHFGDHFLLISLLCYVVITLTVLVGVYMPARNISNVNPIDALRDE